VRDGDVESSTIAKPYDQSNAAPTKWEAAGVTTRGVNGDVRRIVNDALKFLTKEHIFSLVDQALVSGTSFLTTLLVARFGGAGELGIYAIGISVLVSLLAFQDSLILQPYTIRQHSPGVHPADHGGASLIFSFVVSVGCAVVLALAVSGALAWEGTSNMLAMIFAIAAVLPFVLTREFARRTAIAQLEMLRAVVLDAAVSLIQLCALALLGFTGRMSAVAACAALGGANGIVAAGWLCWGRHSLNLRPRAAKAIFAETWDLGKWLLVGRATVQVQGYVIYWIAIVTAGAVATGVLAACMSVVNIITPVILALGNVMVPRSVLAWRSEGGQGLWREATRNAVRFAAVIAPFCIFVLFGGEALMHRLYPGSEYHGSGVIVAVLAFATFATALGGPASFALATMERPRAIVVVGVIGAVLSVGLVALSMMTWGLLGAAFGLLAGNTFGTIGRWIAFKAHIPQQQDKALLAAMLRDVTKCSDLEEAGITWIGGGEHADVFKIVQCAKPSDHERDDIVVKLYKPQAALKFDRVQEQFTSLLVLHTILNCIQVEGWRLYVPRPLYLSRSPLAFAMTAVPGRAIDACTSAVTPESIRNAARAFTGAMERCWLSGRRHGDLGLSNLLFDLEARTISVIDAGTRESCRTCSEIAKFPSAQAADLAHALCDMVRDITDFTGRPPAHVNRDAFVKAVLATVIERQTSAVEKRQVLSQIWECFEEHLIESFGPSWSLKGAPHQATRIIARNRARSIINSLMPDNEIDRALNVSRYRISFE
jgi:O-antigen/teichoic acid export membrane protein